MPVVVERLRHALPGRLIAWLLGPLLWLLIAPQTRRAGQAASAARAILDGWAPQEPEQGPARPRFGLDPRAIRTTRIPLRYAAHVLIVAVAICVFVSNASPRAGVLHLEVATSSRFTTLTMDRQVRWILPAARIAGANELTQPNLRTPQPSFEPAFVASHELVEGEILGDLASRYRVSVATLFWSNGLERGDVLAAGQELRIPRISGVPYVIVPEDTLESIAEQFQVSPDAIVLLRANGVDAGEPLPIGNEIFIPGGIQPYPAEILSRYGDEQGVATMSAVAAGVVQESETNLRTGPGRAYPRVGYLDAGRRLQLIARHENWVKIDSGNTGLGWVRADLIGLSDEILSGLAETDDFPPPPPVWVWPTRGSITSSFGWRSAPFRSFHDGIDIANAAGTRIYAARSGRVFEAGWCSGFGYCVKIDHGDGVSTIYGHMLKKPPVGAGTTVEVGDLIGYMGSTFDRSGGGFSTGVHLHFTVKVNGKAVNPLKYLP
jgi:murein DD-endopeptidase MepM/ murein hydrolase activator NlpD